MAVVNLADYKVMIRTLNADGGLCIDDRMPALLIVKFPSLDKNAITSIISNWYQDKIKIKAPHVKYRSLYQEYKKMTDDGEQNACMKLAFKYKYAPTLICRNVLTGYKLYLFTTPLPTNCILIDQLSYAMEEEERRKNKENKLTTTITDYGKADTVITSSGALVSSASGDTERVKSDDDTAGIGSSFETDSTYVLVAIGYSDVTFDAEKQKRKSTGNIRFGSSAAADISSTTSTGVCGGGGVGTSSFGVGCSSFGVGTTSSFDVGKDASGGNSAVVTTIKLNGSSDDDIPPGFTAKMEGVHKHDHDDDNKESSVTLVQRKSYADILINGRRYKEQQQQQQHNNNIIDNNDKIDHHHRGGTLKIENDVVATAFAGGEDDEDNDTDLDERENRLVDEYCRKYASTADGLTDESRRLALKINLMGERYKYVTEVFDNRNSSIKDFLENPCLIVDPVLRSNIIECSKRDDEYSPRAYKAKRETGNYYENKLVEFVRKLNVPFETEKQLKAKKLDRTPDILFPQQPITINRRQVNWIESKAIFADHKRHNIYLEKQLNTYSNRFGPGLVIYWFGYVDRIVRRYDIDLMIRYNLPNIADIVTGEAQFL